MDKRVIDAIRRNSGFKQSVSDADIERIVFGTLTEEIAVLGCAFQDLKKEIQETLSELTKRSGE